MTFLNERQKLCLTVNFDIKLVTVSISSIIIILANSSTTYKTES